MNDILTAAGLAGPSQSASGVQREQPDVEPADARFVRAWTKRVQNGHECADAAFKNMRRWMDYVRWGADKLWVDGDNYVANITQQYINKAVAALYAKNPKAEAKRRKRLEYVLWDGKAETYTQAVQLAQQGDPQSAAVIQEVEEASTRRQMLERIGKTLEILFDYYTSEQQPTFKKQMKQLVRRAKVNGIAYLELDFQRLFEKRPEITAEIADMSAQLATVERILQDIVDGEVAEDDEQVAELRAAIESLRDQETYMREGPIFQFPKSTQIVVDPRCTDLRTLKGARWLAKKMLLTPAEVQEEYNVDVRGAFMPHKVDKPEAYRDEDFDPQRGEDSSKKQGLVCVWKVQDKGTGTCFAIAEGYKDFLKRPAAPYVRIERFFTIFPLVFNDVEHEEQRYPLSDVHYMQPMQDEINRARQGLREHKKANRPAYATVRGRLEEEDKANLANRPPNAIVELNALGEGERVENVLQAIRPVPIDPNVYETNMVFEDILRTVGVMEANFGTMSKGSATESAIAESSRVDTVSSNVDDLDDFLTEVARATGQLMLMELDESTVKEIAGPGAVWPDLSREEIAKEIFLEIKAGSSGKPNRAAELANYERGMPFILQMPGISPSAIARPYLQLLDIDPDEAIADGLPSITALNAMAGRQSQPGSGPDNPMLQGGAGGDNAERPPRQEPGAQPAFQQRPEEFYMQGR